MAGVHPPGRCLQLGIGTLAALCKATYHLVFETTAIALAGPAFGLDVYWFLFWQLVLDWVCALGVGLGLVLWETRLLLD